MKKRTARKRQARFVVCVRNKGYEASLEVGKFYRVIHDAEAEGHGYLRIVDDHTGCEWIEVIAQGVPAHVDAATSGGSNNEEDPYAAFLPPAFAVRSDDDEHTMRAVVFVTEGTPN